MPEPASAARGGGKVLDQLEPHLRHRHRDIDGLFAQQCLVTGGFNTGSGCLKCGMHFTTRLPNALAGFSFCCRGQRANFSVG